LRDLTASLGAGLGMTIMPLVSKILITIPPENGNRQSG